MSTCKGLFAHSLPKMETVAIKDDVIIKRCPKCGMTETLPRSDQSMYFYNVNLLQRKKLAYDDNRKEALQPTRPDGSINEDFTTAFGFNPFDPMTKANTPRIQGGLK